MGKKSRIFPVSRKFLVQFPLFPNTGHPVKFLIKTIVKLKVILIYYNCKLNILY